jgi:hypothetical protein
MRQVDNFTHIIAKAVTCINFIKSRALNHHYFHKFLEDTEAEYGNMIYFCEV